MAKLPNTANDELETALYLKRKYGHKTTLVERRAKLAAACRSFYEWSLGLGRRKKMARRMAH
jgi:hypothetical protein